MTGDRSCHLQIEVTNKCNLHCFECPNRFMTRNRTFMSTKLFRNVVQKVNDATDLKTVIMHKDGEPLLHPFLADMVQEVSRINQSTKVDIYTNGILLTPDLVERFRGLPNKVSFLITYHKYDHNGEEVDYTKAWESFMSCLDLGLENVEYILVTHATNCADIASLEAWQQKWLKVKMEKKNLLDVHLNPHINHWAGRIEGNVHFAECPYGNGEHLFVGVDGTIIPCCMDLEEELSLGLFYLLDMDEIFSKTREFYSKIKGGNLPELCKRCLR